MNEFGMFEGGSQIGNGFLGTGDFGEDTIVREVGLFVSVSLHRR